MGAGLKDKEGGDVEQSRWLTKEFLIYYLILAFEYGRQVWTASRLSQESSPGYQLYSADLSRGWILGRLVDNSDPQWRSFRAALPQATVLFLAYTLVSRIALAVAGALSASTRRRLHIRALLSIAGVFLIHGLNTVKILAILTVNYAIGRALAPSKAAVLLTWAFALATIFAIEYSTAITEALRPLPFVGGFVGLSALCSRYGGLLRRWDVTFKISMLRMISYNMDYHFSFREYSPIEVPRETLSPPPTNLPLSLHTLPPVAPSNAALHMRGNTAHREVSRVRLA